MKRRGKPINLAEILEIGNENLSMLLLLTRTKEGFFDRGRKFMCKIQA